MHMPACECECEWTKDISLNRILNVFSGPIKTSHAVDLICKAAHIIYVFNRFCQGLSKNMWKPIFCQSTARDRDLKPNSLIHRIIGRFLCMQIEIKYRKPKKIYFTIMEIEHDKQHCLTFLFHQICFWLVIFVPTFLFDYILFELKQRFIDRTDTIG